MRLKVVGGPHDGKWVIIKDDVPYIKLTEPILANSFDETIAIDSRVMITTYTKRRLHFSKDHYMEFLAPEEWTDRKAIEHQFTK